MSINTTNKELGEGGVFCNNDGVNCSTVQQATNPKYKVHWSSLVILVNPQISELCEGALSLLSKEENLQIIYF